MFLNYGYQLILRFGDIVDSVSEVTNIEDSEVGYTPAFGLTLKPAAFREMPTVGVGGNILLDIGRVFLTERILMLKAACS
jgi:hypothetical protein